MKTMDNSLENNSLEKYMLRKSGYGIEAERQEDMEIFHERTRFHPTTHTNKSIKVGNYMNQRYYVHEMINNFKPYPLSKKINLPKADLGSLSMPFADMQKKRTSVRAFEYKGMDLQTLSNLLGSAAGVNRESQLEHFPDMALKSRTYPSAGNLFPIEIYPVLLGIDGVTPCVTHYDPINHRLDIVNEHISTEDIVNALADFDVSGPGYTKDLSAVIVLSAIFQRSVIKYEERGYRFALLEAGIVGYNFSLASIALGWASLNWGAYYDGLLDKIIQVDGVNETTVNCILIGNERHPSRE